MAHAVELEGLSLEAATCHEQAMTHLIDFNAAFPLVSHQFMQRCLQGLGAPELALSVIKLFYVDGSCRIAVGGSSRDS